MANSGKRQIRSFLSCAMAFITCVFTQMLNAQISHGGTPSGYSLKSSLNVEFVTMPFVDNVAMIARDAYTWKNKGPYNFGEKTAVNLGPGK